jgi:hypothetical protein
MDVLTLTRDPTFPRPTYAPSAYEWPSDAVLAWTETPIPSVTSLVPASAQIGGANFTLHVQGTGFGPGAVILWNGNAVPTTVVSPTEATTPINMATLTTPGPIPVSVQLGGVLVTNSQTFTVQPAP